MSESKRSVWKKRLLWLVGAVTILGGVLMFHVWKAMGQNPKGMHRARLAQSQQYRDGKFRNDLPNREDMVEVIKQVLNGSKDRVPKEPLHSIKRNKADYAGLPQDMRLTWFGHSSILVELDGKRILTDPVWGPRTSPSPHFGPKRFHEMPLALEDLPELDAVVISHDHYDHLDYPSITALAKTGVPFYVPLGVGAHLSYWGVASDQIHEMDWWQSVHLGGVEMVFTPARHFSGRGVTRDQTLWGGWAILGRQKRLFYSGDSGMFPGFKEIGDRLGPFDVTFMESGAYNSAWPDVHMGPEQAVQAHRMLRGKLLIPVHWGTFSLAPHAWTEPVERIRAAAATHGVDVWVPRQGELFQGDGVPEQEIWWPTDVSWQRAEEAPVVSTNLPPGLDLGIEGH